MKPKRHPIEQVYPPPVRLTEVAPCAPAGDRSPCAPAEDPMRCVWSGYPAYERACRSRIPTSVVIKAWRRERQVKGSEEGFFYFSWRCGVWLAFGTKDGNVRGVYCPTHCSERDARETQGEAPGQAAGPTPG
jgi:hypothetical protein